MMRGGRNPALFYYERTVRRWHTQTARWWLIRNLARTIPGSERTASTGSRLIALSASARRRDWETGLQHPAPRHPATTALTGNDQRAVTIECASDTSEPYAFRDVVYQKLIVLCADICKRNGKKKLLWLGDKDKTLNYSPKSDEMILTVHRWFANKSCPGNWMYARMGDLATKVTAWRQYCNRNTG